MPIQKVSQLAEREHRQKIFGAVPAIVTDNNDPEGKYRVMVRFPWLQNGAAVAQGKETSESTQWVRIATFMAGPERGAFWLPEINDEVLVIFEHGDINRPYVIGMLWNGEDKAPYGNVKAQGSQGKKSVRDPKNSDGFKVSYAHSGGSKERPLDGELCGKVDPKGNSLKFLRSGINKSDRHHQLVFNDSKAGSRVVLHSHQKHRIVLDDADDKPKQIEIIDGAEQNYILIDTANKRITIESKTGDMLLKTKKLFRIEAENIEIDSKQDTKFTVGKNYTMTAQTNMELEAKSGSSKFLSPNGAMTIKGKQVNIN